MNCYRTIGSMRIDFAISSKALNPRDVTQRSPLIVCLASVVERVAISFKTVSLSANCGDVFIADGEEDGRYCSDIHRAARDSEAP